MADKQEQEEIIIIQDSDAIEDSHDSAQTKEHNEEDEAAKQKKIILFGGVAIIVVLLIVVSLLLYLKTSKHEAKVDINFLDKKLEQKSIKKIEPSKLESMIAKANYLYATGSKEKALNIYEKIAQYSQAISLYNLGVAQLKDKQYETALHTFQQAIQNDEKRCVSAINAAVCSLHLQDQKSFQYYIDLAYAYLPYEVDSPLYSYYYTLISYYNKDYLEALNSLKNSTTKAYPKIQNHLSAKIDAMYENNYDAIDAMEKTFEEEDDYSLALLYARVGDFTLATNHLEDAIAKNNHPMRSQLALALINLKAGHIQVAASQLRDVTNKFPQEVYKYYPIKVKLKDSLFEPQKAQKHYRKDLRKSKTLNYQKLFYFSPYKVFNANHTISYIRKGNANIYIDNVKSAQQYLKKSFSSSQVNLGIAKAIKLALSFKIRAANEMLQKLVKIQPKHSILQYDLALTYAQMGNIQKANEHFLRSYYLDAKNYLSGVYAVMTSQLINKRYSKLKSILKDSLSLEDEGEEIKLYKTLIDITENNFVSAIEWLDNDYKQRPLYLAMDIIIATKLGKTEKAKTSSEKLLAMQKDDIVPNIIYIDTHFQDYNTNKYARKVLEYFKKSNFHFQDLYFGPYLTRFLYTQMNLITGRLYFLRQQLRDILDTTDQNTQEIESALALASLYDKAFEESYTLYNHLIDELKVRDAYTLYLGAVASTAAKHHENAIALLELAKMKNPSLYESRYALALLYMEIQNNPGAIIQLARIEKDGFKSDYFEFLIDTQKLLFQKQHNKDN